MLVSQPYIAMTLAVMESFGVTAVNREVPPLRRAGPPHYTGRDYAIEPDASAASYFFALAARDGGYGHRRRAGHLEHPGRHGVRRRARTHGLHRTARAGPDHGHRAARCARVDVDMNAFSDTVMTLAVVALFAHGVTRIRNVAHIRHKETDRIAALATELRKLGARVDESARRPGD